MVSIDATLRTLSLEDVRFAKLALRAGLIRLADARRAAALLEVVARRGRMPALPEVLQKVGLLSPEMVSRLRSQAALG